jgi:hypothetical protein
MNQSELLLREGVVAQQVLGGTALVVWVVLALLVVFVEQGLVCCLSWPQALLIQLCQHTFGGLKGGREGVVRIGLWYWDVQ